MATVQLFTALNNIFNVGAAATATATPSRLAWTTVDGFELVATGADVFAKVETLTISLGGNVLLRYTGLNSLAATLLAGFDTTLFLAGDDEFLGDGDPESISGGEGADLIRGLGGNDTVYGGGDIDRIYGGNGIDKLYGEACNDLIEGNGGNDMLDGGTGHDLMRSGDGNDRLSGGSGDDFLVGGLGADVLTGGAGWDRFEFYAVSETGKTAATSDLITDFQQGADKIDLLGIDANDWAGGNQAFAFIGMTDAFNGVDGALKYAFDTAHNRTVVAGDINGDTVADFQVELQGLVHLKASDFLL